MIKSFGLGEENLVKKNKFARNAFHFAKEFDLTIVK